MRGRPWCPMRDDSGRGNGEASELRIVFWRQSEKDSQERTSALVQQPFPSRGGGSPHRGRGLWRWLGGLVRWELDPRPSPGSTTLGLGAGFPDLAQLLGAVALGQGLVDGRRGGQGDPW